MDKKLEQLIERFRYIQSCVTDKEAMVWESVRLSEDQIENAFSTQNQRTLHQIQDFLASLDNGLFEDEPVHQYNYVSQLLYEFGYYCSPPSVQSLRSSDVIEWKEGRENGNWRSSLHAPHLYQRFGSLKFLLLKTRSVPFELSAVTVISACCNAAIRILKCFLANVNHITPTESLFLGDILQSITFLLLKPIVDVLTEECYGVVFLVPTHA
ncbi:hypothetical protein WA556_001680 [Blastocystis sp. ATCC 50177/Nand II]